jgi:hypothetical protein
MDAVMTNLGTGDRFAVFMTIPSTKERAADGASQGMSILYTNPNSCGLTRSSAPLTASASSYDFARRLMQDGAFHECRMIMKKFKNGPGVFWLRNIFSLKNGYERKEIKKVTPEVLLGALQGQLERTQALSPGEAFKTLDFTALFALQQGGSFNCTFIEEYFPDIQNYATVMRDPNMLLLWLV